MLVNSVAYCGSWAHIYPACDFVCCVMVSMLFAWCGLVAGGCYFGRFGLLLCCVLASCLRFRWWVSGLSSVWWCYLMVLVMCGFGFWLSG